MKQTNVKREEVMKVLKLTGTAAALIGAVALFAGAVHAETLNWITYKPKGADDPQAKTTQWFADEVERRTDGKYKVRIQWGGSVAGINEIPTALQNGVGDIGDVVTPYFPEQLLVNNAISYFWPQPNNSLQLGQLMEKWYAAVPQFSEEMAKYNMKTVGFRPLESYGMICTKPVHSVAEIKGLRIRSYGFALPAVIKALGGIPVSMGTPDTYEALERKIIDCTPVGPTLSHGWKYDEVAKYYIELPLGASWGHLIAMNLDSYKKLPEDARSAIDSVGKDYLTQYTDEMDKQETAVREGWKKTGVEVIPFPKEEFAAIVNKDPGIKAVQDEWIKKAKEHGLKPEDIDSIVKSLRF